MNDHEVAADPTDDQSPRRRRGRIYTDRRTVSFRLSPELHQRLMELCDDLQTPANSYIAALIEGDLKKRRKYLQWFSLPVVRSARGNGSSHHVASCSTSQDWTR